MPTFTSNELPKIDSVNTLISKTHQNYPQSNKRLSSKQKHYCKACGYETNRKDRLVRHHRETHEGLKYNCGECKFQASRKDRLAEHKRVVHEGIKYCCGTCDYQATRKDRLAEHKKAVHDGVKYH